MSQQFNLHHLTQKSPEWLQLRANKITGTTVKNILGKEGLKKTEDAIQNLSFKIAGGIFYNVAFDEDGYKSPDMERGNEYEPFARQLFRNIYCIPNFIECIEVGFVTLAANSSLIGVSPDGLMLQICEGLEIKCPDYKEFTRLAYTRQIPDDHYTQMQHAMFVTGFKKWHYFAYFIDGNSKEQYIHIEVERDDILIDLISNRCELVSKKVIEIIEKLAASK